MNNDLIDQSLRALDPMPDEVPTDSLRAQRALDGFVVDRPARRSRSRTVTRLALAGGVAAALALSAVDVPSELPDAVIGEQRGPWTFIALSWANGESGSCLFRAAPESGEEALGMAFFRGDPTKIGGRPLLVPTPDSIEANGLLPLEQSEGDLYQLTGASGDDVTRVVIHAGQLGEVEATVQDGRFAAWWPEARISPVLPFDPDVTLHLRDGSTVTKELSDFTHIQK